MAFNFGGLSFGAPNTTTSTFGFGSTTPKTTGGFGTSGFTFGTTTQTSAPSFNLGSMTTTTSTGFSLGGLSTSSASAPTFGSGFGGFGSTSQPQQTGFGGFGSGTSLFGSTATTTTASTGFSFSNFGQTPATTTTAPSLFSGFGQMSSQNQGFGTFNKPLGGGMTQSSGFGGFGLSTPQLGQSGFGQQQTQQQQQQQLLQQQQQALLGGLDPIYNSVFNVCMFGDERDEVLSKWNLLQACWGTGKGFYAPNVPPVDYTPQNPLCRFKAIAYNVKPGADSKEGIVGIHFNKKEDDIRSQENQLLTSLNSILGNKPHLVVAIDAVRPVSDTSAVVYIYVEEKAPNGMSRRISNTELCSFLLGATPKQQLTTMGAVDLFPHMSPDRETLQNYLDNPPRGIESGVWKQAQTNNPDPERLIPVGVIGFNELRWRVHCQTVENKKHQVLLDKIAEEIAKLDRENQSTKAKLLEARHNVVQLEHRLLKVLVKQEVTRNVGVALRPDEELLRSQLDTIHSQLNSPNIKGRLNELLAQIRMQKQEVSQQDFDSYSMSPSIQEELKQFLEMQQNGVKALLDILHTDLEDMKIMKDDMIKIFGQQPA